MPRNGQKDKDLQPWQAQEEFSVVDFLAEAPDYFAREPFTIHVNPRSSGIHEFLNLQIQLKVARLGRLTQKIQDQIQTYQKGNKKDLPLSSPSPVSRETHDSSSTKEPETESSEGKLVYKKGNKVFEIAVSQEQLNRYFEDDPTQEVAQEEKPIQKKRFGRDIFDRFLNEPGFFKRSNNPESVPPDASIEASVTEDETVVTETLAKIHQAQGNNAKAMSIYKKLGLLFPEKSSYFEAQIEKLQDLDTKNDA